MLNHYDLVSLSMCLFSLVATVNNLPVWLLRKSKERKLIEILNLEAFSD